MAARNHIELVEKTLRVLETLAGSEGGCSVTALAAQLGLVKSSTFRILYSLKEQGYVERVSGNGPYRLTRKVLALARSTTFRPTLLGVARPYLARIRDQLRESVWLAEWRRERVVIIDETPAKNRLQLSLDIGDRCPLHASALGKAIAAYLPHAELAAALGDGKLSRYTAHTQTSRVALSAELAKVRRLGYAINEEETIEGAILAGAPIFDAGGAVFASLSVSCPTARCTSEKRHDMALAVMEGGRAISSDLAGLGFCANNER
jgi:DNA-binding IclR family transcriptional regulator